jgi:hypothetical protein
VDKKNTSALSFSFRFVQCDNLVNQKLLLARGMDLAITAMTACMLLTPPNVNWTAESETGFKFVTKASTNSTIDLFS